MLGAPVQRLNCSLVLQLAKKFLQLKDPNYVLDENVISKDVDGFLWIGGLR